MYCYKTFWSLKKKLHLYRLYMQGWQLDSGSLELVDDEKFLLSTFKARTTIHFNPFVSFNWTPIYQESTWGGKELRFKSSVTLPIEQEQYYIF